MTTTLYCAVADVSGAGADFSIPAAWTNAEVEDAIAASMQQIDSLLRDHFLPVTKSLILDGKGKPYMSTRQRTPLRILSITKIQYRSNYAATDDFDTNGEVIPNTDYIVKDSRTAILRLAPYHIRGEDYYGDGQYSGYEFTPNLGWILGPKNYKVTGTFGWNSCPKPIRDACILLTREAIQPGYISSTVEPKVSERFQDGYQWARLASVRVSGAKQQTLTGWESVDGLIAPFQNNGPMFVGSI